MSVDYPTTRVTYLPVIGFPGYRVGDDGSVWSCLLKVSRKGQVGCTWILGNEWRRLKANQANGRAAVSLCKDGRRCPRLVYRLVLEAFVGPCPDGMEACHFDDNPWNNRLSNLRWDTPKANKADAIRNGKVRPPRGERHHNRKVTDEVVRAIRDEYAAGGITQRELAARHGIDQSQVSHIVSRRHWAHVT